MPPERAARVTSRLAWSVLALLLTACVTSPRSHRARALTPGLQVDAALLAMADARRADLRLLDSVLNATPRDRAETDRQRRAILMIGQLRVQARYPVLRSFAAHEDTAHAATAIFALGLARDTASLEVLVQSLNGQRDEPAAEAAWALGLLGEPARPALEAALRSVREGHLVAGHSRQIALLRAASTLRPVPSASISPFLLVPDARVASAAAYGIARSRAAGAARALLAQAGHADAGVRAQVAAGAAPSLIGDSLADAALRVLPTLMRDPDLQVRVQAVRSAGATMARVDSSRAGGASSSPQHQALTSAMRAALRDTMAPVRVTAAEGIAPAFGNDSTAWRDAFDADTTFMVQRALLDAASRRGQLLVASASWQQHRDPWRRLAAFEFSNRAAAAGTPPSTTVFERTAWARVDVSPRVRAAAATALAPVAEQAVVREALDAMQTDPDPLVRANALSAIASRATASDARGAVRRYRADSARDGHVVRSAALRVIASAWRRDSLAFDADLRAQLSALPVPADPLVRRGVRDVTPMEQWAAVDGPVVANADYRRVAADWLGGAREVSARLHTERGVITLALLPTDAPLTVDNFVQLARRQYFTDTRFHRVIAGFVAQDGDPTGTGSGGPGRSIRDELNRHRYERGAVGMALSGPDTGGSQYFLTLTPQPHLDGGYTVFARVTDGFDVMDALLLGDRILRVEVP
jgi:cyclophilin family peptidyl-prolyl cis-trans isomerase